MFIKKNTNEVSEQPANNKKGILYSASQTPPTGPLFFSSLQHMLLIISLGMALPVTISRTAGLNLADSGSLMAAALFSMGLAGILQTIPGKFIGSGYQSLSVSDSAALSACILAAQIGGVPLVLGMTIFSGVLRFILGSFTFKMRKLFPPEVTGTMVFILGINLVPTGLKNFLGTAGPDGYDYKHLIVAVLTLLFMISCTLFIRKLKPYTALAGIVFGFVVSIILGVFDVSEFKALGDESLVALPIYNNLSFDFDLAVVIPFIIITVAAVVDNIGDYSACQNANDANRTKPDWRSIEGGIRGGALGSLLAGLIGGPIQSTATTNIGIAGASGITSRKVAYLAGGMLMVASFFPVVTGALSLIPTPVLGAVIIYSMCYIMSGGFQTLASRALDSRKIFVVFLSIGFSMSTLVPDLYSFLPEKVSQVIVSPMVMGVGVLLITTLFCRIGTKKKFEFTTKVDASAIPSLNQQLDMVCKEWSTDRILSQKLQIGLDSLCEGFYEISPETKLYFTITYDQIQVKLKIVTQDVYIPEDQVTDSADTISSFTLTKGMLSHMFDDVRTSWSEGNITLNIATDL